MLSHFGRHTSEVGCSRCSRIAEEIGLHGPAQVSLMRDRPRPIEGQNQFYRMVLAYIFSLPQRGYIPKRRVAGSAAHPGKISTPRHYAAGVTQFRPAPPPSESGGLSQFRPFRTAGHAVTGGTSGTAIEVCSSIERRPRSLCLRAALSLVPSSLASRFRHCPPATRLTSASSVESSSPKSAAGRICDLAAGRVTGKQVWQHLKAANRVGVTRGTLEERRNPLAILRQSRAMRSAMMHRYLADELLGDQMPQANRRGNVAKTPRRSIVIVAGSGTFAVVRAPAPLPADWPKFAFQTA